MSEAATGIIYLAINGVNGKLYVGKTGRTLPVRIREHTHDARNKEGTAFTKAVRKYGIKAFQFAVLEVCGLDVLDERERYWIKLYRSRKPRGYNLTDGGDGCLGLKRPDVTERLRAMTGPKNHMFGRTFSAEERKRFGQPGERNARFGVKLTDEEKALVSQRTKEAMARPDVRERFMANVRKSPEARKKLSAARKAAWADPIKRQRFLDAIRKSRSDPSFRAKVSASVKAYYAKKKGAAA